MQRESACSLTQSFLKAVLAFPISLGLQLQQQSVYFPFYMRFKSMLNVQ